MVLCQMLGYVPKESKILALKASMINELLHLVIKNIAIRKDLIDRSIRLQKTEVPENLLAPPYISLSFAPFVGQS